jgi:hypothetical protein
VCDNDQVRVDYLIDFDASRAVRDALERIGRIEDVAFSPSNARVALSCLDRNSIAVADVEVDVDDRPRIVVTDVAEFHSPSFNTPHGVDFLDDDRIVVANRYGRVHAFRLPPKTRTSTDAELTPIDPPETGWFEMMDWPGSIRVLGRGSEQLEALICNNRRSTVTYHELTTDPWRVTSSQVLLRRLLDFPDSVSVTSDRRWIAISSHDAHVVMLYRWDQSLSESSDPDCILRGTMYPHGLQFSADGQHLIVADAGRPHVNLYARPGEDWCGVHYPDASARVMSDDVYARGRDHESSGPKGVAIDNTDRVLVVTYEKQPITFFDVATMLQYEAHTRSQDEKRLAYEVEALEEARDRLNERTKILMDSASFRITKPLRVLRRALRKWTAPEDS